LYALQNLYTRAVAGRGGQNIWLFYFYFLLSIIPNQNQNKFRSTLLYDKKIAGKIPKKTANIIEKLQFNA